MYSRWCGYELPKYNSGPRKSSRFKRTKLAADPAATETVLAEGQTVCEMTILDETSEAAVERMEEEVGAVVRGHLIWGEMDCPGSYGKARMIVLQDLWNFDRDNNADGWLAYHEAIPEEGGVWKGTCDNSGGIIQRCVLEGGGINAGKRLETRMIWVTMKQDYRIVQVNQE